MKNHLGSYECKLCLTLHNNEVCPLLALTPHFHTPNPPHDEALGSPCLDFAPLPTPGQLPRTYPGQETSDQLVSAPIRNPPSPSLCSLGDFWGVRHLGLWPWTWV